MPSLDPDAVITQKDLKRWIKQANAFVAHVNRMMSTPAGMDKALMTVSYTLTLLAPNLQALSKQIQYPTAAALKSISTHSRALIALISDVRIFMRLWGIFGIYDWGRDALERPCGDKFTQGIVLAQVAVNAGYQVLENLAYLAQHGVLPIGKKKQGSMWLWSSRFWMAHVGLEFLRLGREKLLRDAERDRLRFFVGRREIVIAGEKRWAEEEMTWKKQLLSNCAYAPLTVHWSMEKGPLSQPTVGALGSLAAFMGLHQAWMRSA